MWAPNPTIPEACSETAISVSKSAGKPFAQGEQVKVSYQLTYNDPKSVAEDLWSVPHLPSGGLASIPNNTVKSKVPQPVPIGFGLCTFQLQTPVVEGQVSKVRVRVRVEFNDFGGTTKIVEGDLEIIPWGPEAEIATKLISECKISEDIEPFDGNLLATQTRTPNRVGDKSTLSGTLFRNGIPAPLDQITFYKTNSIKSRKPVGAPIGTAKTNARGEFSVAIPLGKPGKYKLVTILGIAAARVASIGPIPRPFPEEKFDLIFNWSESGKYETGSRDWFPRQASGCRDSYRDYIDYANDNDERFKRDKHPFIMYAASKAVKGAKGKRSYSSDWEWRANTGGSCTISWWERNGRRISGYTVRCDKG
jgi:hypothetical protein